MADKSSRKSSILKTPKQKPRAPLQDVNSLHSEEPTTPTVTLQRRVSFAGTNLVKEFYSESECASVWQAPAYEEPLTLSSDSSGIPSDCSSRTSTMLQHSQHMLQTSSITISTSSLSLEMALGEEDPCDAIMREFGCHKVVPSASKPPVHKPRFSFGDPEPSSVVETVPHQHDNSKLDNVQVSPCKPLSVSDDVFAHEISKEHQSSLEMGNTSVHHPLKNPVLVGNLRTLPEHKESSSVLIPEGQQNCSEIVKTSLPSDETSDSSVSSFVGHEKNLAILLENVTPSTYCDKDPALLGSVEGMNDDGLSAFKNSSDKCNDIDTDSLKSVSSTLLAPAVAHNLLNETNYEIEEMEFTRPIVSTIIHPAKTSNTDPATALTSLNQTNYDDVEMEFTRPVSMENVSRSDALSQSKHISGPQSQLENATRFLDESMEFTKCVPVNIKIEKLHSQSSQQSIQLTSTALLHGDGVKNVNTVGHFVESPQNGPNREETQVMDESMEFTEALPCNIEEFPRISEVASNSCGSNNKVPTSPCRSGLDNQDISCHQEPQVVSKPQFTQDEDILCSSVTKVQAEHSIVSNSNISVRVDATSVVSEEHDLNVNLHITHQIMLQPASCASDHDKGESSVDLNRGFSPQASSFISTSRKNIGVKRDSSGRETSHSIPDVLKLQNNESGVSESSVAKCSSSKRVCLSPSSEFHQPKCSVEFVLSNSDKERPVDSNELCSSVVIPSSQGPSPERSAYDTIPSLSPEVLRMRFDKISSERCESHNTSIESSVKNVDTSEYSMCSLTAHSGEDHALPSDCKRSLDSPPEKSELLSVPTVTISAPSPCKSDLTLCLVSPEKCTMLLSPSVECCDNKVRISVEICSEHSSISGSSGDVSKLVYANNSEECRVTDTSLPKDKIAEQSIINGKISENHSENMVPLKVTSGCNHDGTTGFMDESFPSQDVSCSLETTGADDNLLHHSIAVASKNIEEMFGGSSTNANQLSSSNVLDGVGNDVSSEQKSSDFIVPQCSASTSCKSSLQESNTLPSISALKPKSITDILKEHKAMKARLQLACLWTACREDESVWSFDFISFYLKLKVHLGSPSVPSGLIPAKNGEFICLLKDNNADKPIMRWGRCLLMQELSKFSDELRATEDFMELLERMCGLIRESRKFVVELIVLEKFRNLTICDDHLSFNVTSIPRRMWFIVTMRLDSWKNYTPSHVSVKNVFGRASETIVKNMVNGVPKDIFFFRNYIADVRKYMKTLESYPINSAS